MIEPDAKRETQNARRETREIVTSEEIFYRSKET